MPDPKNPVKKESGGELVPLGRRALTAKEFHTLAEVPPEVEWFANIRNRQTRRACEIQVLREIYCEKKEGDRKPDKRPRKPDEPNSVSLHPLASNLGPLRKHDLKLGNVLLQYDNGDDADTFKSRSTVTTTRSEPPPSK